MVHSKPTQVNLDKEVESIGGEVKGRINTRDGRSFKEVLEGFPQTSKSQGGWQKAPEIWTLMLQMSIAEGMKK